MQLIDSTLRFFSYKHNNVGMAKISNVCFLRNRERIEDTTCNHIYIYNMMDTKSIHLDIKQKLKFIYMALGIISFTISLFFSQQNIYKKQNINS